MREREKKCGRARERQVLDRCMVAVMVGAATTAAAVAAAVAEKAAAAIPAVVAQTKTRREEQQQQQNWRKTLGARYGSRVPVVCLVAYPT